MCEIDSGHSEEVVDKNNYNFFFTEVIQCGRGRFVGKLHNLSIINYIIRY